MHNLYKGRIWLAQGIFVLLGLLLTYRMLEIQFFYPYADEIEKVKQKQINIGEVAQKRVDILDRNGAQLAVSSENYDIYVSGDVFTKSNSQAKQEFLFDYLASVQKIRNDAVKLITAQKTTLIAKELTPAETDYIQSLRLSGLWADKYYTRYYPAAEVAAQLLGFVDKENRGIEGIELLYDDTLSDIHRTGSSLRDAHGNTIKIFNDDSSSNKDALYLSVDLQLQYTAYHHLVNGCRASGAKAGIAITLDALNGEVLAMAQYPSFNPNNRKGLDVNAVRNRALTDVFEPGSTFKPLVLASILENTNYNLKHKVNTSPGYVRLGGVTIRDSRNLGALEITDVIAKSSNVGMSRLSGEVTSRKLIDSLYRLGIGRRTGSGFPGEREGYLPLKPLSSSAKAILSYGYGLSVTPMQLTKAYGVLANGGEDFFVTLLKDGGLEKKPVIDKEVTTQVIQAMRKVISPNGTGRRAQISGYMLAGKTGTVHKSDERGYAKDKYIAVFVGVAPAINSRFVTLIMLDEPSSNKYYGGEAAAPIFASYMKDLFNIYAIPPDNEI